MNFDALNLILVATDLSDSSAGALQSAIRLAQTFHVPIELLHIDIDPALVLPPPGDLLAIPFLIANASAGAAEGLQRAGDEVRKAGVTCTVASESGRTATAIVEHARRRQAGLVVLGSHARHGLSHLLMGSVAEKVVEHAPCGVLVVPSPASPSAS